MKKAKMKRDEEKMKKRDESVKMNKTRRQRKQRKLKEIKKQGGEAKKRTDEEGDEEKLRNKERR